MGHGMSLYFKPDVTPNPHKESAFEPEFGFKTPRTERGELKNYFLELCSSFVYLF